MIVNSKAAQFFRRIDQGSLQIHDGSLSDHASR